jgi:hypothetical protein
MTASESPGGAARTTSGRVVDPREALVERVRTSASLQNSRRQQELFRFLADCALRDPPAAVSEQQVGVAVFGREPSYDTSVDTIVRVQVSQLRKKLEHYFLSEGRDEPTVIELPRGSYVPVFRLRVRSEEPSVAGTAGSEAAPPKAMAPAGWHRQALPITALAAGVLLIGCAWLAYRNAGLQRQLSSAAAPHVEHFWRQFFEDRLPTQLALSDSGVLVLSEALERSITLSEYRQSSYPDVLTATLADEKIRTLMRRTAIRGLTTPNDAVVAHTLASLCSRYQTQCSLVSARDLRVNLQTPENVILLGHKRTNPWVELFEGAMSFQYHFDDAKRYAYIVNRTPLEGEADSYRTDWGRKGYCVVGYLPKPGGGGSVLLVFGADLQSVEAGGHFISDERSMAELHKRLGVSLSQRFPYVEALLQTKLQGNQTGSYELIAQHLVKG